MLTTQLRDVTGISVPTLIYNLPQDFNALDFKVVIDCDGVDRIRNQYINPSHSVFDIIPPTLGKFMQFYRNLLSVLQLADNIPPTSLLNETETNEDDVLPLIEGCLDLPFCDEPNGPYYMGGVGGGLGLDTSHHNELDTLVDDDKPDIS
ncbi:uncharacterized protein F5891DRAFT_1181894 [Suillus fuscotomentosus]|uniref:Uncharacterized protein n=1 Tax=Suillus fuscotomentosus TaxID=1912939 RepID=A0AAD4EK63_9AGAM|nr:uncharacterized protein F5891DRAFT_1181894 [Suillus fuscotomentosus]KAG1906483.1 hypothetical protein F5891DRAFT_1181894 [Suillus fuscotomentosus]